MSDEKKSTASDSRDYENFVYFASRASNCGIIYKPRVERILDSGEKVIAKDEKGKEMLGLRIEFQNHNLSYKKDDPLAKPLIAFLRSIIEKEKDLPKNKKMFIEMTKPIKQFSETEVNKMMKERDVEIKRLKEKAGEKSAPEKTSEKSEAETPKPEETKKEDKEPF